MVNNQFIKIHFAYLLEGEVSSGRKTPCITYISQMSITAFLEGMLKGFFQMDQCHYSHYKEGDLEARSLWGQSRVIQWISGRAWNRTLILKISAPFSMQNKNSHDFHDICGNGSLHTILTSTGCQKPEVFSVSVPGCTAMTPQHSIKKGSTLTHFQANVISYNRKLIKESRPLRNEKTEPHGKDFSTFWVFLLFFFSSVIKARDLTLPIESNSLSATSILLSLKKQLFLPLLSFS